MHRRWIPFSRFLSTFALLISPLKFAQPSSILVVEFVNKHHLSPNFASLAPCDHHHKGDHSLPRTLHHSTECCGVCLPRVLSTQPLSSLAALQTLEPHFPGHALLATAANATSSSLHDSTTSSSCLPFQMLSPPDLPPPLPPSCQHWPQISKVNTASEL